MTDNDVALDADVIVVGAGMSGLYALKVLRDRGLRADRAGEGPGRRGHLVLEPLPGRPLRHPEPRVLVRVRPRARAGVGLDRALRVAARDRGVPQPHRRPLRPAPRHPVLAPASPPPPSTRRPTRWVFDTETGRAAARPLRHHGHGRPVGTAPSRLAGHRDLRRHDRADQPVARGRRRARGEAGRRRGHRLVGHPGDPRAGRRSPPQLTVFQRTPPSRGRRRTSPSATRSRQR